MREQRAAAIDGVEASGNRASGNEALINKASGSGASCSGASGHRDLSATGHITQDFLALALEGSMQQQHLSTVMQTSRSQAQAHSQQRRCLRVVKRPAIGLHGILESTGNSAGPVLINMPPISSPMATQYTTNRTHFVINPWRNVLAPHSVASDAAAADDGSPSESSNSAEDSQPSDTSRPLDGAEKAEDSDSLDEEEKEIFQLFLDRCHNVQDEFWPSSEMDSEQGIKEDCMRGLIVQNAMKGAANMVDYAMYKVFIKHLGYLSSSSDEDLDGPSKARPSTKAATSSANDGISSARRPAIAASNTIGHAAGAMDAEQAKSWRYGEAASDAGITAGEALGTGWEATVETAPTTTAAGMITPLGLTPTHTASFTGKAVQPESSADITEAGSQQQAIDEDAAGSRVELDEIMYILDAEAETVQQDPGSATPPKSQQATPDRCNPLQTLEMSLQHAFHMQMT